jgi:hypothetical protein
VVVAANLPLAKKAFADKPKYDESSARVLISVRALTACERTACTHLRAREKFLRTNMPSTEVILTDNVPGLGAEADVQLVWDQPWNQNMISEAGRMKLGMI